MWWGITHWDLLGGTFSVMLPGPPAVATAGWQLLLDGSLLNASFQSISRVLVGCLVAISLAVPLGVAIGWFSLMEDILDPVLHILRPIPPIAWIPLAILWFGLSPMSAIFIITVGAFFPSLVNTTSGIRGVDRGYIEAARTLGARTQFSILRKVALPAAMPSVLTGIRISFGIGWMAVVAGEMLAVDNGLGWMILNARRIFRPDIVIVGMMAIGSIGFIMDAGLRRLEAQLLRWRPSNR